MKGDSSADQLSEENQSSKRSGAENDPSKVYQHQVRAADPPLVLIQTIQKRNQKQQEQLMRDEVMA